MSQNAFKHDIDAQVTDVRDPSLLVDGCADDEYVIQERKDVGLSDLAQRFQISDFEQQLVDTLLTDPYRSQTKALMKLRPNASPRAASVEASRIMSDVNVRSYLKYCIESDHEALVATKSYVQMNLRVVAERCMQVEPVLDAKGQPTGDYKFDASGANTALKLLGQTIGMFKEESRIKIVADRPLMTITVPKRPKKEVE